MTRRVAKRAWMASDADGSIMSSVADFERGGDCFVEMLSALPADAWNAPAIGDWTVGDLREWTVGDLAGHTARTILTLESYLSHESPGSVGIDSAEEYYATVYPTVFDPAVVHADGVEAGRWLADDPAGHVSDALARTRFLIGSQPHGRAISIGGMGILLSEYLRTRVVELVLHTIDLSHATGVPHSLPVSSLAAVSHLVASVRPSLLHGEERLLAATFPEGRSAVATSTRATPW